MWTKFLDRPELIEGLYQYGPVLTDFRLSEISWDHDEGICLLRGTLSQFADYPRPHWEDDANRVGIRLRLESVREFEFDGTQFYEPLDLSVDSDDGGATVVVTARGQDLVFRAVCSGLSVDDVFAYHALDRDRPN